MLLCPKCGDYYNDSALAFCPGDGAPLVRLDTSNDKWSEGARIIAKKEDAVKQKQRRLKWWRLASWMTMLLVTMVMYGVVAKRYIYLVPPDPSSVYKISGRVMDAERPLRDISITMFDGAKTVSTTTDANGNYSFSGVPAGGNYTISPRARMKLTPPSRSLPNLAKDEVANFDLVQPAVYKIRGRVTEGVGRPLSGINIKVEGSKAASTTTDANGNYGFPNLTSGGSYTITPGSGKIKFQPPVRTINNLARDESADFSSIVPPSVHKISGRVTDGAKPLNGVNIKLSGSRDGSTTTDGNGNYGFSDLPDGGSYTVTPDKAKANLTPRGRSIRNLTKDESADFSRAEPECSEADKSQATEAILNRYRDTFKRRIESQRDKIVSQFSDGTVRATAELEPPEYGPVVLNQCSVASVRVRYVWRVSSPTRAVTPVRGEKRFACFKLAGAWLCP